MTIVHQTSKHGGAFALEETGQRIAEISYQYKDRQTIIADHTWVDPSQRGAGVARKMLDALVSYAREQQLKIVPQCSYVDVMFRRDSSFADVNARNN